MGAVVLSKEALQEMANAIRLLTIDAIETSKSGHPGLPLGMADVAAVLWGEFLHFNPQNPTWANRDRFVLSAGHGSMLLYALLYLTGFPGMSLEEIKRFRALDSATPGHPEYGHTPGVEVTTGPLAQGLAHGVGMALAEAMLRQEFGADVMSHRTYVLVGDGCLMEGLSQEAISFAGHLGLANLTVLFDDNRITIDGPTSLATSEDQKMRFEACGWHVVALDGHDYDAIRKGLREAQEASKPTLLMCRTTIGYGAPKKAGTAGVHGAPLGPEEAAAAKKALGYAGLAPFEIPESAKSLWGRASERGKGLESHWDKAFEALLEEKRVALSHRLARMLPEDWRKQFRTKACQNLNFQDKKATRQWSQEVLNVLSTCVPGLLGGSADLTGSNNTKAHAMQAISPDNFSGDYVHYGIREHLMGACMNGLVLHGGFVPYGGTFLVFSDYMRPTMRLAALMEIPSIFVLTHDSIGLGEDGPTHQPVEHLASLRLIPNLYVFRPADAVETAECWEVVLGLPKTPSCIALSRQPVSCQRTRLTEGNLSKKGGYVLSEAQAQHKVTLLATGTEVGLARTVQEALEGQNIGCRLVSMPCLELFAQQDGEYQQEVLSADAPILRVAIEAAHPESWHPYVGEEGLVCGVETFGLSAPCADTYDALNLSAPKILEKIIASL